MGATPPASLFEITLGDEKDFYDVSIVDGYNLPLVGAPQGVHGGCNVTGCVADINMGLYLANLVEYLTNIHFSMVKRDYLDKFNGRNCPTEFRRLLN
ncbi:hypothetical protein CASFOL_007013 [Castilleja foliolosa]|uniref:Uncharacterized protein n=1 Tax=Castilleja foliolosa TaxID=1961234 RepID=A0ABD3E801_9LAMI